MKSHTVRWTNPNTDEPPFHPEALKIVLTSELEEDSTYRTRVIATSFEDGIYSGELACWFEVECITIKAGWKELGPKMTIWTQEKPLCEPDCLPPVPEPMITLGLFTGVLLLWALRKFRWRNATRNHQSKSFPQS